MGLFARLFGATRPQPESYIDSGLNFIKKLTHSIPLPDWQEGHPGYTESEKEAMTLCYSQFERMTDSVARESGAAHMAFHPDVVETVQRMLDEIGLKNYADGEWKYIDSLPNDWRKILSTYLKALMCNRNPLLFLDIGELLVRAGRTDDAREAAMVATKFRAYARSNVPKHADIALAQSMKYLFRDAIYQEAYAGSEGLYSARFIKWLNERARIVDWMAQGK